MTSLFNDIIYDIMNFLFLWQQVDALKKFTSERIVSVAPLDEALRQINKE